MTGNKAKLVYSSDREIPRRERPDKKAAQSGLRPAQQKVTVRLERKGRGGKSVTVVEGLQMPRKDLESFFKTVKMKLGTGGTVKEASLEIQGDHRNGLIEELVKRALIKSAQAADNKKGKN